MSSVSLGFSKNKKAILSKVICWAQGTPYSHVYIRVNSKYGEYVYQASGLAVNFTNIETFLEHNLVVEEYEFQITEEQKTKLLTFFVKYAGRPYSMSSLFKIAVKMVFKNKKFEGDGDKSFICSELGSLFLKEILMLEMQNELDFITPEELYDYISKNGNRIS